MPYTSVAGHKEIKLGGPENSSLLTGFHGVGRGHTVHWRGKLIKGITQYWIVHDTIPTCQAGCAHWCNGGTTVMGTSNCIWITHKVYSIGVHAWYCKRGQKPMVRDVIGRGEPMTVILPSGNVFKLLSKYMCLYCRLVLLNLIQRNISL